MEERNVYNLLINEFGMKLPIQHDPIHWLPTWTVVTECKSPGITWLSYSQRYRRKKVSTRSDSTFTIWVLLELVLIGNFWDCITRTACRWLYTYILHRQSSEQHVETLKGSNQFFFPTCHWLKKKETYLGSRHRPHSDDSQGMADIRKILERNSDAPQRD